MMASPASCVCLVLVAVFIHGLDARYSVNSVTHPDCSSTFFSMESGTQLSVKKGDPTAPCTGYVNYDTAGPTSPPLKSNSPLGTRRVCADDALELTTEIAQRLCYTLGTNMYRLTPFTSSSTDQVMLYVCDSYRGPGVTYPVEGDSDEVAGVEGSSITGPFCATPSTTDFCVDDCYDFPYEIDASTTEDECDGGLGHPWWATTGIDHDECIGGVLANCQDWSPDSCTPTPACGENTECENTQGGWECDCKDGYKPIDDEDDAPYEDGCEDINECEDDEEEEDDDDDDDDDEPGICGYDAKCINTPGSYICICMRPELYDDDDGTCIKSTCPALPVLPYAVPTQTVPQYPKFEDTVTYSCLRGYGVVDQTRNSYYNTQPTTTFELECSSSGQWSPYPIPICQPINCDDPGYKLNAHRTGSSWDYEEEVTFTCQEGYRPEGISRGTTYFKITCEEDGSWTKGTTCEDIDECEEQPGICGNVAKYCINTIGSYLCSCVPWYQKDPLNNQCFDWTEDIPSLAPCVLIESMGLCVNGDCYMDDGKASCRCEDNYEGVACDRPKTSATFIIAVFALVCVVIIIILLCMCCCYRFSPRPHAHVHQPAGPLVVEPTYGGYSTHPGMPHGRYIGRKPLGMY